jgi:hypothetical protein
MRFVQALRRSLGLGIACQEQGRCRHGKAAHIPVAEARHGSIQIGSNAVKSEKMDHGRTVLRAGRDRGKTADNANSKSLVHQNRQPLNGAENAAPCPRFIYYPVEGPSQSLR